MTKPDTLQQFTVLVKRGSVIELAQFWGEVYQGESILLSEMQVAILASRKGWEARLLLK